MREQLVNGSEVWLKIIEPVDILERELQRRERAIEAVKLDARRAKRGSAERVDDGDGIAGRAESDIPDDQGFLRAGGALQQTLRMNMQRVRFRHRPDRRMKGFSRASAPQRGHPASESFEFERFVHHLRAKRRRHGN